MSTFLVTLINKEQRSVNKMFMRTGWFRSTLGFDLLGFRSILVSICTRYQFQTAHYSIYTNSDLHIFRSAQFSLCNFWICKDFALLSIRSARISIYMYFDMQINFRSMDFSICKSNFDLQIFRSANQISIYRFFDLQIKFRSTDFSICKSSFDLQIFRSANQVSIYRYFHLQIKFHNQLGEIHTMPVNIHIYPQPRHSNL